MKIIRWGTSRQSIRLVEQAGVRLRCRIYRGMFSDERVDRPLN